MGVTDVCLITGPETKTQISIELLSLQSRFGSIQEYLYPCTGYAKISCYVEQVVL